MIRYKRNNGTFNFKINTIEFVYPTPCDSVVDKSQFRPNVNDVANFIASSSGSGRVPLYDFPDGVDNGLRVQVYLRDKSRDVTEIDQIGKSLESLSESQLKSIQPDLEKARSDIMSAVEAQSQTNSKSDNSSLS